NYFCAIKCRILFELFAFSNLPAPLKPTVLAVTCSFCAFLAAPSLSLQVEVQPNLCLFKMPMKDTNFLMGKVIHKRYKVGERIAAGEYSPLLWQRILLLTTLPF